MLRLSLCLTMVVAASAAFPAAQTAPKLVVMIVVDQMRADYLDVFKAHWKGGFRTLLNDGAVFERGRYPFLHTVTCAGHSTIGTGTFPRTHGMILNAWWHRDERQSPECTADPATPAVTYGRNVSVGNSPKRLLVPTLADELREQKPGARVVAISLKSRGAIPLAGKAGDAVVWFDDPAGTFTTSRTYANAPVPAVKAFIDKQPFEKDLGRVWSLSAAPGSYVRRDAGIGERPPAGWTGLFPHPVTGRGATPDAQFFARWQSTPLADKYLAAMAIALVDSFALGQRAGTDFLSVSFSTLDDVGHAFGPDSREVEEILRQLDTTLGELLAKLDATVGRANYVLGFSADHGVAPFGGFGRGGRVHTEDIRDRVEETLTTELGRLEKRSYVEAQSTGFIYLSPGVFDTLKGNVKAYAALQRAIEDMPGVAKLLRTDQLSDRSSDPAVRAAALSYMSGRGGELVVVSEPYWYITSRAIAGTTHGSMHDYDQRVPLILLGGGIKPGRVQSEASPADIAPTLAQLAGVKMPKAEGKVLKEALR
jgi:predicted AlkP superfamily pyrophosphatase or phosphodiesterase